VFVLGLPVVSYAQATLRSIVTDNVLPLFTALIGLIMTLSVLAFILGVARFMYTSGDDKSRAEGKKMMLWGIIALFLMVALWGVVALVKTTFFG